MTYPQTIRFDVAAPGSMQACGRAIYSSYHTLPTTTSPDPTQLVPQERILEYLMLEAGKYSRVMDAPRRIASLLLP